MPTPDSIVRILCVLVGVPVLILFLVLGILWMSSEDGFGVFLIAMGTLLVAALRSVPGAYEELREIISSRGAGVERPNGPDSASSHGSE